MNIRSRSAARGGLFEVSIGSLDDPNKTVYAQYRPAELQMEQSVPWNKHENVGHEDKLWLEFSGSESRSVSLVLLFDASEISDGSLVDVLHELASLAVAEVTDPNPLAGVQKRPHHCVLVFGKVYVRNPFKCVIESVSTKYTMFSPDGAPIRATATLKLKEAKLVNAGPPSPARPTAAAGSVAPTLPETADSPATP